MRTIAVLSFLTALSLSPFMASCELYYPAASPNPDADPSWAMSKPDFDAWVAKTTDGFTLASSQQGHLESVDAIPVRVEENKCYVAVIELDPGAAFADDVNGNVLVTSWIGGPMNHHGVVKARGAVIKMGCSRGTGPSRIDVSLDMPPKGQSAKQLGTGTFTVKLFQLSVDAKTMEALNKRRAQREAQDRVEAENASAAFDARRANQTSATAQTRDDASSRHYSLSLHNSCNRTVKLFIGEKPPFSSGTNTSLGSNTTTSYSGTAPENIWVVDDSGNPVSSYTTRPGMQTMQILESCSGFSTY
jgi:hypothetical protein